MRNHSEINNREYSPSLSEMRSYSHIEESVRIRDGSEMTKMSEELSDPTPSGQSDFN